jgi:hypothetical protein
MRLAYTGVAGHIQGLAPLVGLTDLILGSTQVGGQLGRSRPGGGTSGALAPLVGLTALDLSDTEVEGDVEVRPTPKLAQQLGQLQPFIVARSLERAWADFRACIFRASLTPSSPKGLAPLARLAHLNLHGTRVVGRAAALAPLVHLSSLDLGGTEVAGCAAFCAAGGPFHTHCPPCGDYDCVCQLDGDGRGAVDGDRDGRGAVVRGGGRARALRGGALLRGAIAIATSGAPLKTDDALAAPAAAKPVHSAAAAPEPAPLPPPPLGPEWTETGGVQWRVVAVVLALCAGVASLDKEVRWRRQTRRSA